MSLDGERGRHTTISIPPTVCCVNLVVIFQDHLVFGYGRYRTQARETKKKEKRWASHGRRSVGRSVPKPTTAEHGSSRCDSLHCTHVTTPGRPIPSSTLAQHFSLFHLSHCSDMKPRNYCCCAIPLVNTGIYATLLEQLALGLLVGILAIATPSSEWPPSNENRTMKSKYPFFSRWGTNAIICTDGPCYHLLRRCWLANAGVLGCLKSEN